MDDKTAETGDKQTDQSGQKGKRLSRASGRRTIGRSTFKNTDPYFIALEAGNLELVMQYVPSQCAANKHNSLGKTGLHIAASLGYIEIMEYLIDQGADVNFDATPSEYDKKGSNDRGSLCRLPLHDAAELGQAGAVSCLIRAKTKLNEKDGTFNTPLHLASREGHIEVVRALCDNGAHLDITNVHDKSEDIGDTPLMLALAYENHDIAVELVQRGADLRLRNKKGEPAYLIAYLKGYHDILQLMWEKLKEIDPHARLNLNTFDYDQNTLFHEAAIQNDVEAIITLHKLGGDPTTANNKGRTALFLAAKHGNKEAMEKLYELGVNHTETDNYDTTPLEIAEKYLEKAEGNSDEEDGDDDLAERYRACIALLQEWPEPQEQALEDDQNEEKSSDEEEQPHKVYQSEQKPSDKDDQVKQKSSDHEEDPPADSLGDLRALMLQFIDEQPNTTDSAVSQPLEEIDQPQTEVESNTPATDHIHAQFIEACRGLFDPEQNLQDPEVEELLRLISTTKTLDEISTVQTNSGYTIFCLIAKYDSSAKLIPSLKQLTEDQINKLLGFKTSNGENALHIACQFLHLILFEFCIEKIPLEQLVVMARAKTINNGYTPFHILCTAAYDDDCLVRKRIAESEQFFSQAISRVTSVDSELPADLDILIRRMGTTFGEYPDIFKILDNLGNTGLMLCCYTLHTKLITVCLDALKASNTVGYSLLEINQSKLINPLRYVTMMGNTATLQMMMSHLGDDAQRICLGQELLQWSQMTTVPYPEYAQPHLQLSKILEFLIRQYFWDEEKHSYTETFKNIVISEFRGKTLLLRSLDDCGGFLIYELLSVKHLSRKPEVLFLLMEHMTPSSAPYSPRGFGSQTSGLNSPKKEAPSPQVPKHVADLRRILLHRVFRVDWPDALLHDLSLHIVSTLGTPRYKRSIVTSDEKILRCITSNLCDSVHQNLPVDFSVLILALFYQVSQVPSSKKELEFQYIEHFRTHSKTFFEKISSFLQFLNQEGEGIEEQFLNELFEGKSLLKAAIIELFPEQAECLRGERSNFIAYIKQLISESKESTQGWCTWM